MVHLKVLLAEEEVVFRASTAHPRITSGRLMLCPCFVHALFRNGAHGRVLRTGRWRSLADSLLERRDDLR
eukprot:854416-Pleurochrysis_carterae.AAC.2